ncbi:MAG TPA: MATE family efflux transporter [Candidatus Onthocola gallistercoris]|uniref:Probable multidrug resistance protein NorM n=1 Tax=Candidatus Onthocola gallistercoris TaxID=2840876 RepID=A0A9D1HFP9_9FIRM|nr:MATE family efflux transporter [Candidatus Onthocola gallistercoris]
MTTNMTKGKIVPQLVGFTIPLVLGNLFQLTYNAADSVIVGQVLGEDALAAVGSAGMIMNLVILFISGMCMGAGILMSTQYGAGSKDNLERQISTTLIGGLIFSLAISVVMMGLARYLLIWTNVPAQILDSGTTYLRIVFAGLVFTFVYNFFSNTLRALGDSKSPLLFLIVSAILNVGGDLLFVAGFGWGVAGSAIATVLSQGLCCLCCVWYIRRVPALQLGSRWKVFDRTILWRTFSFGITSALQMMCIQLGKLIVQSIINVRGVSFMAAYTAVNRVDDFALTPQQNIAHAATTFMAQNKGAGQKKRFLQGFGWAVVIQMIYTAVVGMAVFSFPSQIMSVFVGNDAKEVIHLGSSYLHLIGLLYFVSGTTHILQGFFRGTGDLKVTLVSTIANMTTRVLTAWYMLNVLGGGFDCLAWANLWGWVAMMILEVPLMIRMIRKKSF